MENIYLILWICLWPIAYTIDSYINSKRRMMTGERMPSEEARALSSLISIIIWIVVAVHLTK